MRVFCRVKHTKEVSDSVQFPLINDKKKVTTQSIQIKTKQG